MRESEKREKNVRGCERVLEGILDGVMGVREGESLNPPTTTKKSEK